MDLININFHRKSFRVTAFGIWVYSSIAGEVARRLSLNYFTLLADNKKDSFAYYVPPSEFSKPGRVQLIESVVWGR